jgi:hypothetical protein
MPQKKRSALEGNQRAARQSLSAESRFPADVSTAVYG